MVVSILFRGRVGYDKYRREFSKLIWQIASPKWKFDDATFDRSAAAFNDSDHVSIVIHNYRWRLGLAQGEAKYDDLEKRLAAAPVITVPTITLEGAANGAPHPEPSSYTKKFSGKHEHRLVEGGIRRRRRLSPRLSSTSTASNIRPDKREGSNAPLPVPLFGHRLSLSRVAGTPRDPN